MIRSLARSIITAALLLVVGCGYAASTQFNADGSVTVGLEFLFPKELLQGGATGGTTIQGFSAADIARANAELQKQYPGGKIEVVAEGDEDGARITIPFKNEKDAFAFLTQPSKISPSATAAGTTPSSIDLSQTGGFFATAQHTTDGPTDTYTFTTQAATIPTPSPDASSSIAIDELASVFTITFSLTLPHEITSAPGALFTLDRKTAVWKVKWTQSETFTATTSSTALAGAKSAAATAPALGLTAAVAVVAALVGLVVGVLQPWRRRLMPATAAAPAAPDPLLSAPAAPVPAGLHVPSSEMSPPADLPPPPPPNPAA